MSFAACCQYAVSLRSLRRVLIGLMVLVAVSGSRTSDAQVILYVDDDAPAGGDGLSWATAFQHPQQALDVASSAPGPGYVVKVGQGRYVPTNRTDPNDPRSATLNLMNNVALTGGYAGLVSPDPDVQDLDFYPTVLTGDVENDDQPNFAYYFDNLVHIVTAGAVDASASLQGFFVMSGNAADIAGAMRISNASPTITQCVFALNYECAIVAKDHSSPMITQCGFYDNIAVGGAGISFTRFSTPRLHGCRFERNNAEVGAGIFMADSNQPDTAEIIDCEFVNNVASVGSGGAQLVGDTSLVVRGCLFKGNSAGMLAGALLMTSPRSIIIDSQFIENHAGFRAGGVAGGMFEVVNSVFLRNTCDQLGGGLYVSPTATATIVNTSFAWNLGGGLTAPPAHEFPIQNVSIWNSVFWDNSPTQIGNKAGIPSNNITCHFSSIQGGWSGAGSNNIDANPMFLQAGCDNLRLAHDSPCIDAGDNIALPPGTDTDLDGQPRIQNRIVDMGAYEGGHDPLPPMACEDDLDQGEYVNMIPGQGTPSPAGHALVGITNVSGSNDASVTVSELIDDPHPGAGGCENFARTARVETTLLNGQMIMFVRVPFNEASLNGADPLTADLMYFEPALNRWILAVEANTQNSPDHPGTVGDRFAQSGPTNPALSTELGDHGVFWNTTTHRGYVWANVDHATDFAAGLPLPLCPADCDDPADGQVNLQDLVAVIKAWGQTAPTAGPRDVNDSGVVDMDDIVAVITAWGACPQ